MNVYANYDMAARHVCEELEIVLWHGDDTCESLTYRLGNEEQQFIKAKMDDYCRKCEGMALDDFCAYLEKEENPLHQITTEELRQMPDREGLVLQGCGGELQEWVDGINDLLTEAGILLDGTRFETVSAFQHDGLTNLLFSFDDSVKLDMGKLAMWRLQTHGQFGGTWLSDYVPNRLGGFVQEQITVCCTCLNFRPGCMAGKQRNITICWQRRSAAYWMRPTATLWCCSTPTPPCPP